MSEIDDAKASTFTKAVTTVACSLLAAGVIGVWSMSISLARLDERFSSFSNTFTERLAEQVVRIQKLEERVNLFDKRK